MSSSILANLAFAVGAALLGGLVAAWLRQSLILGYLFAGVAIGPFTPGPVGDLPSVQALADIGIIFLLFAVGVQLSFRDLLRVGKLAIGGGSVQVLALIGIGYFVGMAMGFQPLEAVFFGAVLSNSSSTVLSKVLEERGETGSLHGRIAFAWSSVQDLSTVILVVVLSALATEQAALLGEVAWAMVKALLFLGIVAPLGAVALPWLFERIARLRQREVFILSVAVTALGTAYLSSLFGLSVALGAFIAGVVVGESDLSHQILGEVLPLRDVFAGLFFVSVGMLLDPAFVLANLGVVAATTATLILAKGLVVALLVAAAGYSPRVVLATGALLAQSAEFSFLLASLGVSLGALGGAAFGLVLAGAVLSIVLAPWLYRVALHAGDWLEARLPPPRRAVADRLANEQIPEPRGHALICGYGRVGSVVHAALERRGFPVAVIDNNVDVVRDLRKEGVPAFLGNAANQLLLSMAGVQRARLLVVAIPEALTVRQVVDTARELNPRLDIVCRTHSREEREFLEGRGVAEAVLGELELALEITRHALRRFGLSAQEVQAIISGLRQRTGPDQPT